MSMTVVSESLVVGPDDNGLLLTADEFDTSTECDDSYRYKLINRVLIVNPNPGHAERDSNEELEHLLRNYQEQHPGVLDKTLFEEYVRTPNSRHRADRVNWVCLGCVPDSKTDVPTRPSPGLRAQTGRVSRPRRRQVLGNRPFSADAHSLSPEERSASGTDCR